MRHPPSGIARAALLVALVAGVLSAPVWAASGAATQGSTAIQVGNASGTPGATVTVDVTATADNVSGYEAGLTYDPDVVRVAGVEGIDFADPITNVDESEGRLNITQVSVETVDDPTLARVSFELVGDPTNATTLAFEESDTVLFGPESDELWIDRYGQGSVTVLAPDTPTPTATPSPTATATAETTRAAGTSTASPNPTAAPTGTPSGATASTASGGEASGTDGGATVSGGASSPTAESGETTASPDDDSILDQSFLLGAGVAVLIIGVGLVGYLLGQRG